MSRVFLGVLLAVCIGCGSGPSAEVQPPPKQNTPPAVAAAAVADGANTGSAPAPGVPPETIFFASEYGNVTFTHQKHFERVNGDCATCHPKIFPQSREPLNYGKARHRSAEEYGTSCAACHGIKSTAFAAERNCQRCHDMGHKR